MGTRLIDHGKSVLLALLPLPTQETRSYEMVFKILKHSHNTYTVVVESHYENMNNERHT